MKRLLVTGGQGKLAKQIAKNNKQFELFLPSRQEMDITIAKEVESYIKHTKPDIILHAAAYTRPMAKHKTNPDLSLKTNIIGTANIALSCMHNNIKMAYISTDYVYPGTQGNYKETDPVSPYHSNNDGIEKYGWSKLGGEACTRLLDNFLIFRLCMSNKPFPHPNAAIDIKKSYLYEDDAARIILKLLNENGIINIGGPAMTAYNFARQENLNIGKLNSSDIKDVRIAPDTSMNIEKMNELLTK